MLQKRKQKTRKGKRFQKISAFTLNNLVVVRCGEGKVLSQLIHDSVWEPSERLESLRVSWELLFKRLIRLERIDLTW